MKWRFKVASLFVLLAFFPMLMTSRILDAQDKSSATQVEELNGFALWQFKTAMRRTLGEPSEMIENDLSTSEVHYLSESGYMVFEYCHAFPENMCSIQITGMVPDMEPFHGLKLGDPVTRVHEVLGTPLNLPNLTEPKVQLLRYHHLNGSVEIDEHGRLFSIRIQMTNDMLNADKTGGDPWAEFVSALRANDTGAIFNALRPDVEIYREGNILRIEKKYSDFRKSPDQVFMQALLGPGKSVLAQATAETPYAAMRVTENMGIGMVYKFKRGEILSEVVFFPFNSKFRIYEIAFKSGLTPSN